MNHQELLIDGVFYGGPCDQSLGKLVIRNPFDNSIVGTAAEGGWPELNAALDAATRAHEVWGRSTVQTRQRLLRSISSLVCERANDLADLLTSEVGKPITLSHGEVTRLAITFDLAADALTSNQGVVLPTTFDNRGVDFRCEVERFPLGVVLAITPYNWPYNLTAHKVAPALATGNTVVLKPSPLAPLTSLALARLIHEAGCPDGVLNAVVADANVTARAVTDPRVHMVSFTGSENVGWGIKQAAFGKKVTLELGGDASVIVMPDSDLEFAAKRTVLGAFGYAGQICISVQHVLVHDSVYEEFVALLTAQVSSCPTGDPRDPNTVCGPLIHSEAADRVKAWIDDALDHGAKVLIGGQRVGNMIQPTLIENANPPAKIATEEVFGPVLNVRRFGTVSEAIELVNASRFGIQTGVFTNDPVIAEEFYRRLDVGGVVIGDAPSMRFDNMPYGGNKRSGFGREGVQSAMDDMTQTKVRLTRIQSF